MESDHRTFDDLFYACCQELDDIGFVEALHRIMTLTADQLRQMGMFCEKTAIAFFDTVMSVALIAIAYLLVHLDSSTWSAEHLSFWVFVDRE